MESKHKHNVPMDFRDTTRKSKHMSTNKMSLFNYTQPDLMQGLMQVTKVDAGGNPIGVSLTLAKRKDVAKAWGLQTKGQACTDKLIELADNMKQQTAAEFMKMAASNDWTGAGFSVRTSKNGVVRATARLVSIRRETKTITPEQLAESIKKMDPAAQKAFFEAAALLAAPKLPDVEVKAEVVQEAAAPAPEASADEAPKSFGGENPDLSDEELEKLTNPGN